ncbi:hypothetical protein KA005_53510 [bacterium]|nr:hypothetical protein [bacterium]
MENFISIVVNNIKSINWEGPASFGIILLALLAIFRKWSILLITLFTIVLGWGAQDLIITNLLTSNKVISVPLLIYSVGGGIVIILLLISFFKSSIK